MIRRNAVLAVLLAAAFVGGLAAAPATFSRDRAIVELSHLLSVVQSLDREQKVYDDLMLEAMNDGRKADAEAARVDALAIMKTRTKANARILDLCHAYGLGDE